MPFWTRSTRNGVRQGRVPRDPLLLYSRAVQPVPFFAKEQRNSVFEALIEAGMNPADCKFEVSNSHAHIVHTTSESFITFYSQMVNNGTQLCNYFGARIGEAAPYSKAVYTRFTDRTIRNLVVSWVSRVQKDLDVPDLWGDFRSARELLSQSSQETASNTPFSLDEQAQITRHLKQISEYMRVTYALSNEQMSRIETRLDEAEVAARRIGRKDWLLMFLGILFSLIITGLVTPTAVEQIFAAMLHALRHLFGDGGNSLPGSADR